MTPRRMEWINRAVDLVVILGGQLIGLLMICLVIGMTLAFLSGCAPSRDYWSDVSQEVGKRT